MLICPASWTGTYEDLMRCGRQHDEFLHTGGFVFWSYVLWVSSMGAHADDTIVRDDVLDVRRILRCVNMVIL